MSNPPTTAEHTDPVSWAHEVTHLPTPEEATEPVPSGPTDPVAGEPQGTAPALNPPLWSGRKTAIAAALAIGLSTAGALGAAAAVQPGSGTTDQGQFQPGGFGRGRGGPGGFARQQPGQPPGQQQLQQLPGQSPMPGQQTPGQQLPGQTDPNASTT